MISSSLSNGASPSPASSPNFVTAAGAEVASGTTSQRSQQLTAFSRCAGATRAAPTSQFSTSTSNRRPPPTTLAILFLVRWYSAFSGVGGVGCDRAVGWWVGGWKPEARKQTNQGASIWSRDFDDFCLCGPQSERYYKLVGTVGAGGTWQLFRDNSFIGQGNFYSISAQPNALNLGDGSGGGNAQAEVTFFQFTQQSTQLIPEHSSPLSLLAIGIGGLALTLKNKIKSSKSPEGTSKN